MVRSVGLVVLGLALVGCAHETQTSSTTVAAPAAREVIAVDEPPPAEDPAPPPSRPKLTQTITLGQSNQDATYSASPPPAAQSAQGGANVVVNNNVIVQQAPPAVYGGYGGYGYGYGGYGGYGAYAGASRDGYARGQHGGRSAGWGTNGFEGPRRTAAPGQTPGIGGNWSPPPSYGPAPMK